MVSFDSEFAQVYALPLAKAAYVSTNPPDGFTSSHNAFNILADTSHPDYLAQLSKSSDQHKRMMQSMLAQRVKPLFEDAENVGQEILTNAVPNPQPNLHFGWVCIDAAKQRLVVALRGTENFHDWLDNLDLIPAPYAPIPGSGMVHQGFQLVYYAIRNNLRQIVQKIVQNQAQQLREIFITGHSLGGALAGLAAPDLVNDVAAKLLPTVYTFADPNVGQSDFTSFYNSRVNVCYRVVNMWDLVPHLPPSQAGYDHEGNPLSIDSGFSLDVVRNHVIVTGYIPGVAALNQKSNAAVPAMAGK